jgi:phage/plasmid-associated DNA primase
MTARNDQQPTDPVAAIIAPGKKKLHERRFAEAEQEFENLDDDKAHGENGAEGGEGGSASSRKAEADDNVVSLDRFTKDLWSGSDVEIAKRLKRVLRAKYGDTPYAEGEIWYYAGTDWAPLEPGELRGMVHAFDGLCPTSNKQPIKLGKSRIDSALHELRIMLEEPRFFDAPARGINCASGFIRIERDGTASLEPHSPDHRARHTLPGRWGPDVDPTPPEDSLLATLLAGVFRGDPNAEAKQQLLAEIVGCAALGLSTRLTEPKAVVLWGATAENGKSQVLDLARGVLPSSAICSVPAARMADERHVPALSGKLLNASDELSSATAISSDTFKAVVTGEPIQGREAYRFRIEFRPQALNLFATNVLPSFTGGMDRGVKRRLLVVPFNRSIPKAERIEGIGGRIATEEADLLLAWAVEGARRLARRGRYPEIQECGAALREWLMQDPVLAWLDDRVTRVDPQPAANGQLQPCVRTRDAYVNFSNWAEAEGYSPRTIPAINGFTQRVAAQGFKKHRDRDGRYFLGMVLATAHPSSDGSEDIFP